MGLIEDQRLAVETEIKQARNQRRRAEQETEGERSLYLWSKKNPAFAFEANYQILRNHLANAGIVVSEDSLDLAFGALRGTGILAERVPTPVVPELTPDQKIQVENQRLKSLSVPELRAEVQANIKKQLATPEYGGHGSTFTPSFTASEFARMTPSQVRDLLYYPGGRQERPGVRAGLDKLLRDAQLLKEATN